ncbi:MAG: hypothetical protein ACOY99_06130 [Pseudomonadota bacterium]
MKGWDGILACEADTNVDVNCPAGLFSLEARMTHMLQDKFVDVRDLRSNIPGDQEILSGTAFPITTSWVTQYALPATPF